jgi:hypothetical protein
MKENTCPKCGSAEIIPVLKLELGEQREKADDGIYVQLDELEPNPRPRFWRQKQVRAGLHISMCGACGHCELYTLEYVLMLEAYKKGYRSGFRSRRHSSYFLRR